MVVASGIRCGERRAVSVKPRSILFLFIAAVLISGTSHAQKKSCATAACMFLEVHGCEELPAGVCRALDDTKAEQIATRYKSQLGLAFCGSEDLVVDWRKSEPSAECQYLQEHVYKINQNPIGSAAPSFDD